MAKKAELSQTIITDFILMQTKNIYMHFVF